MKSRVATQFSLRIVYSAGNFRTVVKAWTGTVELTEHGSFHGHFLIWLLGGMNPSDIHLRLQKYLEFDLLFCHILKLFHVIHFLTLIIVRS